MRQKETATAAAGGGFGEELEERGHGLILVDGWRWRFIESIPEGLKPPAKMRRDLRHD
jgi:hypothetical protein